MSESLSLGPSGLHQQLTPYRAPWWLPGGHLQTLWRKLGPVPELARQRQRILLDDGDFIDVDRQLPNPQARPERREAPLVFIIHGLGGCSASPYVLALQAQLAAEGYESAAMNLRGCSGEPNRLARSYHSGCSDDVEAVLQTLLRDDQRPLVTVGYSLGANVLFRWLAESALQSRVRAAVAVSNPFSLAHCCDFMISGRVSRYYGRYFLRRLVAAFEEKQRYFEREGLLQSLSDMQALEDPRHCRDLREFDDRITAPLNGFSGAQDYYDRCSSDRVLDAVTVPTLVIHGQNDPIIPLSGLPDRRRTPDNIHWDIHHGGGHVGFAVSGDKDWLEKRILHYMQLNGC